MTKEQRIAIARIISDMIKADNIIEESEIKDMKKLMSDYNITHQEMSDARKIRFSDAVNTLKELSIKERKAFFDHIYRLVLPDYNNMEVKMEPLVKAVYLLFLNHPEGIMFKHLPDYRKELAEIYTKLRPEGFTDKTLQSIEDVTNPLLNSINEKCARIRGAFVGQFDDHMARHYYIDGLRGEAKKISLPRDLVVWEK